eukprot:123424_1
MLSRNKARKIPHGNLYALPIADFYVFLPDSNHPKHTVKSNLMIYNGIKPQVEAKEPYKFLSKLLSKLKNRKKNTILNKIIKLKWNGPGDVECWIDAQNWDFPGETIDLKLLKRNFLSQSLHVLDAFAKIKQQKHGPCTQFGMQSALSLVGGLERYQKQIDAMDEWNIDHILSRCLCIFQQMEQRRNAPSRTVYPDPKYRFHSNEAKGRMEQWNLGKNMHKHIRWWSEPHTALYVDCERGHWNNFKRHIQIFYRNTVNFNTILLGQLEASLLFIVLGGHRSLVYNHESSTYYDNEEENSAKHEHFLIAQYMLDHGLDVNIQNKFGYTVLAEAVINSPDLEFATFLLKNGADPNIYNIFCSTPLHAASMARNVECVKLLCKYGANPLLYNFQGYQVLDIASAANHIEISTILHNQIRKIKEKKTKLEYEDASYCYVCCRSNKNKHVKLMKCARCCGPEKYCSTKCQKRDWIRHKKSCYATRMKIQNINNIKEAQLIFVVEYCTENLFPSWRLRTHIQEGSAVFNRQDIDKEPNYDKYRKRRKKQCRKEYNKHMKNMRDNNNQSVTSLYPPCGTRTKFVVKIQVFPQQRSRSDIQILCYDKSRDYKVTVKAKHQQKAFRKLYDVVIEQGIETNGAMKGYFYVFVDAKKKLHIFIEQMVAVQPW